jgi:hypothetical protein
MVDLLHTVRNNYILLNYFITNTNDIYILYKVSLKRLDFIYKCGINEKFYITLVLIYNYFAQSMSMFSMAQSHRNIYRVL